MTSTAGLVAVRRQARITLTAALVFAPAAPASALLPHRSARWLPLHLFLGGAVLLVWCADTVPREQLRRSRP